VKPTGNTVSAAVTPLTHMAAKRFEKDAQANGHNAANLDNAVKAINTMVGFDIQNTKPVDISNVAAVQTADTKAREYALYNSGLATLIFSGGDLNSAITKLEAVASSYDDGEFGENDTVKLNDILTEVTKRSEEHTSELQSR